MKELPTISIIIPVYNVEEYIAECLQSVMQQTYTGKMECIIVDDCGTDRSIEIAEKAIEGYIVASRKSKIENPISFHILHHTHNRGLSAARNTGLEASSGEYVYFLDSDDFIDPGTIESLYNAICSDDYAIAISYFTKYIDGKDQIYSTDWIFDSPKIIEPEDYANKLLMQQCNFASTAKLYNKKRVLRALRFVDGKLNEDTLFAIDTIPIIEHNHYKCIELPLYSYHYRMRDESICHKSTYKMDTAYVENIQVAIDRYNDRNELVEWMKIDQFNRCMKIVHDREVDKVHYLKVITYLRCYSNHFIHAQKQSLKAYIHVLLIKYCPHLMWYVEH